MKRTLGLLFLLVLLLCAAACGSTEPTVSNAEGAVGVIFVNDRQALPENAKVYGDLADNTYSFDLDAAWVYYFSANADEAYAGDQNFITMSFAASLDDGTVGAEGTIAYCPDEASDNSVTGYYLYRDENGVYFDTTTYFDRMEVTDSSTMTGIDYACKATFVWQQPTASFTLVTYDANQQELSQTTLTPEEVTDYQSFPMDQEVASVEILCYDQDGAELERMTATPDTPSVVLCFDGGGQILTSNYLRFVWDA